MKKWIISRAESEEDKDEKMLIQIGIACSAYQEILRQKLNGLNALNAVKAEQLVLMPV